MIRQQTIKGSRWALGALVFLIPFVGSVTRLGAAVTEKWEQTYAGPMVDAADSAFGIAEDKAGNLFVTGFTEGQNLLFNGVVIKYGADGAVLWSKQHEAGQNGLSMQSAVGDTGDLFTVTSGRRADGARFYTLARHAGTDGALRWENSRASTNNTVAPTGFQAGDDGNLILIGSNHSNLVSRIYVAKYSGTDGSLLWEYIPSIPSPEYAAAVAVDADGNVAVTGTGMLQLYAAKLRGSNGDVLWERLYDSGSDHPDQGRAVTVDGLGNVIVAVESFVNVETDSYTAKFDGATGELLWRKQHGARANLATVTPEGRVIVGGSTGAGLYVAALAGDSGELLWERTEPAPATSLGAALRVSPALDGNLFVVGQVDSLDYVAKLNMADGTLIWEKRDSLGGAPASAVANPNGDVTVTGSFSNPEQPLPTTDIRTMRYRGSDGAVQWADNYNGRKAGVHSTTALEMDGEGNVIVSGTSSFDYHTAKYRWSDGERLWERRFDGADRLMDKLNAMILDPAGNVIVTGTMEVRTNDYKASDAYTAKYSAATGDVLWEHRHDGPDKLMDEGQAVATDAVGNVIITGSTFSLGTVWDIYTAKYSAETGALVWEQTHDGPIHLNDNGSKIWVDRNGDIIVAGNVNNRASILISESYLAKYSGADGAILWDRRAGPAAAALDSGGNVVAVATANDRLVLAKYGGLDGSILWEAESSSAAARSRNFRSILLDAADNIYISETWVSRLTNGVPIHEVHLSKFSSEGRALWERHYPGRADGGSSGGALTFDANGDLLMLATSLELTNSALSPWLRLTQISGVDLMKIRADDGALVWQLQRDPTMLEMMFSVDAAGRVAMTGGNFGRENVTTGLEDDLAPYVAVSTVSPDAIRVAWPARNIGWRLQALNSPLAPGAAWSLVTGSIETNSVVVPIEPGQRSSFFRLINP